MSEIIGTAGTGGNPMSEADTTKGGEAVVVDMDAEVPAAFERRGRRYDVVDVVGKWRIEGRWWSDGRDREYWRVEVRGGSVWDLYRDRDNDRWHMETMWD